MIRTFQRSEFKSSNHRLGHHRLERIGQLILHFCTGEVFGHGDSQILLRWSEQANAGLLDNIQAQFQFARTYGVSNSIKASSQSHLPRLMRSVEDPHSDAVKTRRCSDRTVGPYPWST